MRTSLWVLAATMVLAFCAGCVTEEQQHLTPAKHGERTTTYGKALDKAEDVQSMGPMGHDGHSQRSACAEQRQRYQTAVDQYTQDNGGKFPPDLDTAANLYNVPKPATAECRFTYDPATGKVSVAR